ncbi:DUF5709 domain-containing protein [Litorihabitans aurantiacus]|uniref:DUF5709 domain-containing protein n=1 Tax=Litorihabitans aurantiacus TaxID=1930061 RepID=A0AA37XFE1_9MICO|nr:DUF5709 domain-containing protein [Litorihabitans aurantiacus]GMA32266.1 hypothetical protein GCM10025875_22580 [Litorihabitans aurantiacus]
MTEHLDPEQVAEPDGDQLSAGDTLDDAPVADPLDESYSPPDRDSRSHWGETALEEQTAQPLADRLAQEEPDLWDAPEAGRESDRAGRLEESGDAGRAQDAWARDAGVAGGAAGAEEAAVHTTSLEELQAVEDRESRGLEPEYD